MKKMRVWVIIRKGKGMGGFNVYPRSMSKELLQNAMWGIKTMFGYSTNPDRVKCFEAELIIKDEVKVNGS